MSTPTSVWLTRGTLRVFSGCAQGALRVRSGYAQGTLRVRSGCAQGTLRVRSGYAQGAIRVRSGYAQGMLRTILQKQELLCVETNHCDQKCARPFLELQPELSRPGNICLMSR